MSPYLSVLGQLRPRAAIKPFCLNIYIFIFIESLILSSTVCCGVMNRHKKYIKIRYLIFFAWRYGGTEHDK